MKKFTTRMPQLLGLSIRLLAIPAARALDATMARIKKSGTIVMGHRDAAVPFSCVDAGMVKGYSIDLCTAVADTVRRELGLKDLKIKWVAVDAQSRFAAVESGKIDIECGVTTNTLGRQKVVDFSPMTFVDGANILVKNESSIKSVLDLGGKASPWPAAPPPRKRSSRDSSGAGSMAASWSCVTMSTALPR